MLTITLVDGIGYLASIVLMVSFLMKSINTLRIVNSIGATLFVIFGFLLPEGGIPIIITNAFILGVNVYYLVTYYKTN